MVIKRTTRGTLAFGLMVLLSGCGSSSAPTGATAGIATTTTLFVTTTAITDLLPAEMVDAINENCQNVSTVEGELLVIPMPTDSSTTAGKACTSAVGELVAALGFDDSDLGNIESALQFQRTGEAYGGTRSDGRRWHLSGVGANKRLTLMLSIRDEADG